MDGRYQYFQYLALYLIKKNIPFSFQETHITTPRMSLDLTLDVLDKKKVWIERSGDWASFSDIESFKKFLKTI